MLAPPPEGTFDIDHESLPLKSGAKSDGSHVQVPLLTEEEAIPTEPNVPETRKVRITWYTDIDICLLHLSYSISDLISRV